MRLVCALLLAALPDAATRGRNVMRKAMLGSITDYVIQRVGCPCLVVKQQVSDWAAATAATACGRRCLTPLSDSQLTTLVQT